MIAPALRFPSFRHVLAASALALATLAAAPRAQAVDTLEVFVLYIEFQDEGATTNEPGTTGRGVFGSDPDISYELDPNGEVRRSAAYMTKRFELAQDYFNKVSNGRVHIVPRLFPPPNGSGMVTPFRLNDRMKAYNPAIEDKSAKQKTSDFSRQRAIQLMRFVSETARRHDVADSAANPFLVAKSIRSPTRHPAFLIFHAGHSRLIDGGTLGYLGANTPNDFTDFFVTRPDFRFLGDSLAPAALRGDSLGIPTRGDTITQFMMLSESATQEGVNWGINGILINQLARQMGMPDLFDVVKGISQVGTFDVMDFAGYNTMQGFLPVFPSAWSRSFMGWDSAVTASPADAGPDGWSEYRIHPADQPGPGRIRTLKVPINEREYILLENRQRAAGADSVTVWFSAQSDRNTDFAFSVPDSVTVPYAFIDSLFLDSLCVASGNNACASRVKNPKRPRGVITRASHYDMGLPGNGLLAWHVNEWFMELLLPSGAVNAWLGDTLRNQYKGLELVEADGVPSIGKEFYDPLGQPAFDYGTPRDMLPHVYRKRRNPPRDTTWTARDTVRFIGPWGLANTNAWNDGRTHVSIEAVMPASPVLAPGTSSFNGDSVLTVRDSVITVRIHWPSNNTVRRPQGSLWPVRTAAASSPRAVSVLRDGAGRAHVVTAADTGLLQAWSSTGRPALSARDTVRGPGSYDSVDVLLSSGNTRPDDATPVNSLADPAGRALGSAVALDSVLAVLTPQGLRLVEARADSLAAGWDTTIAARRSGGRDTLVAFAGKTGPMVFGGRVFALDSAQRLLWWTVGAGAQPLASAAGNVQLPAGPGADWHALAGIVFAGDGADSLQVVVAGRANAAGKAAILRVNPATGAITDLQPEWPADWTHDPDERYTATVSDFDRDRHDDVFLLGSRGAALLVHARAGSAGRAFRGWPQRLPRTTALADTLGTYSGEDPAAPALADLNGDRRPDIIFTGNNGVYAVDWRGALLPGWPFRPQPRQLVGFAYANRNLPGGVLASTPVALKLRGSPAVLVASPDGLVYAVDSAGKPVRYSSFTPADGRGTGLLQVDRADWPLTAGGLTLDTLRPPYVHVGLSRLGGTGAPLDLIAQTATGSLNVWTLPGTEDVVPHWPLPGGDAGRSQRLDAATLGDTLSVAARERIEEFHLYPSPLRGGVAKVHLKLGAEATRARIRIYDISGRMVHESSLTNLVPGLQPVRELDLRRLGPDVYSVQLEVSFPGGTRRAQQRLGVVK